MGDVLVCGVVSDEEILLNKGPAIMTIDERCEILNHCKFVNEVVRNVPYVPNIDLLKKINCDFYAHGDDPCLDHEGNDAIGPMKEAGKFKMFKRTEGVSTTDITGKLLFLAEHMNGGDQTYNNTSAENII